MSIPFPFKYIATILWLFCASLCFMLKIPTGSQSGLISVALTATSLRSARRLHAPFILTSYLPVCATGVVCLKWSSGRHVGLNSPASLGGGCANRGLFPPRVQAFQTRRTRPGARVSSHSFFGPEGMRLQGPAGGSAQTPGGTGDGPGRRDGKGRRPGNGVRPTVAHRPQTR